MRKRLSLSLTGLVAVAAIATISVYVAAGGARPTQADIQPGEYSLELSAPASAQVGGAPFTIEASIDHDGVSTQAECLDEFGIALDPAPYGCYITAYWVIRYDPGIVSIDIAATARNASAPAACSSPVDDDQGRAALGCFTGSVDDPLIYAGVAWNIKANCLADGPTTLTLEEGQQGSGSRVDATRWPVVIHLHHAAIDCIDPNATATATATITETPTITATPTSTRTPLPTSEVPLPDVFLINPATCLARVLSSSCLWGFGLYATMFTESARLQWSYSIFDVDNNLELTKEEVQAFVPFSGNQLHERDGAFVIVVSVEDDTPVAFQTSEGGFKVDPSTVTDAFTCHASPDDPVLGNTLYADEDCDGDGVRGDGVLYAQLLANGDDRGPGMIEVYGATTGEVIGDASFEIVGEPVSVEAGPFETVLQAGLHPADCPLPAGASGFLDAFGTAEKTIIFGSVLDDAGAAITGGWIGWESSDTSVLRAATPSGPSLDLGTFGIAAPNVLCGLSPGTATLTLKLEVGARLGGSVLVLDPYTEPDEISVGFTVLPVADTIELSLSPPIATCGGDLVDVHALVRNVDGDPVLDGTPVFFTVGDVTMSSSTRNGVAHLEVTPSAGGVTVYASVPVGTATLPKDLNDDGIDNDGDQGLEPDGIDDDGDGLVDEIGDATDEGDEFDASIRVPNPNLISSSILIACVEPTPTPVPTDTPTATPTDTPALPTHTPTPAGCAADLNADGGVNGRDVAIVARNLSRQDLSADLNGDGKVSLLDLRLVIKAVRAPSC